MVVCNCCELEMLIADGCVVDAVVIGGAVYDALPYGKERGARKGPNGRCGDCGALPGKIHHHGCDMEVCPKCRQQSIICGCVWQ